MSNCSVL